MCEQACTVPTSGQKYRNTLTRQTQTERKKEKNTPKAMTDTSRSTKLGFSKSNQGHICLLACFQKPLTFDCATLEWVPILSSWDS